MNILIDDYKTLVLLTNIDGQIYGFVKKIHDLKLNCTTNFELRRWLFESFFGDFLNHQKIIFLY